MSDAALMAVPSAKAGLEDMALLFEYLEVYGVLDKVRPLSKVPHRSIGDRSLCRCLSVVKPQHKSDTDNFVSWD